MLSTWRNLLQHDGYKPKEIEDSLLLRVLVFLTVSVAIGATVQSTESSWGMGLAAIALSGIGSWLSWQRRRAKNWWIKLILALMMLVALANFFYGINDNPYDARVPLAHLLIWLQTLHSYDLPRRKDVFYSIWVGLILISVAATTSRSTVFGVYLLVYAMLAISSLLASHLSSQNVKSRLPRFWARFSWPVLGLSLALSAGVFFSLPRYEGMKIRTYPMSLRIDNLPAFDGKIKNPAYPDQAQNGNRGKNGDRNQQREFDPMAYYGFSTELDLNYRGKLSDEVVMKVRSTRSSYWRGMGFDTYDGLRWSMTEPYELGRIESLRQPLWVRETRKLKRNVVPRERVTQTFFIERDQSNLIFKAPYAEQIYFPTDYVLIDKYGGLRSPIELFAGTTYTVISDIPQHQPERLRTISWQEMRDKPITANYYQIPETVPQRVKDLATQLTRDTTNPYDAIKVLENHLKSEYPYDLEIPTFPENRDTVDYFLFEQKAGYCEHFASSLAVMARSLGIPTRFATGYVPGQYNPMTGYFEVRSSDAHGWVEAYFPHHGWVPFDATPGYLAQLTRNNMNERSSLGNFFNYLTDVISAWIPEGVKSVLRNALSGTLQSIIAVFSALVGVLTFFPWPVMVSGIGTLIVLLLAGVYWRSRRPVSGGFVPAYAREEIRKRYVERYLKGLKKISADAAGATPTEQVKHLENKLEPSDYKTLQALTTLYNEVRYGKSLPESSDMEALNTFFERVRLLEEVL